MLRSSANPETVQVIFPLYGQYIVHLSSSVVGAMRISVRWKFTWLWNLERLDRSRLRAGDLVGSGSLGLSVT